MLGMLHKRPPISRYRRPLSAALVIFLPVVLVPAGDFLAFRLFPLHFPGEVRRLGRIGFLDGRLGSLVFRFHENLLMKWIGCERRCDSIARRMMSG